MSPRLLVVALVAVAVVPLGAVAQPTSFIDSGGGLWNDSGNWSAGVPNSASAVARFDGFATPFVVSFDGGSNTIFNVRALEFLAGQTGAVTLQGTSPGPQVLVFNPGVGVGGERTLLVEAGSAANHTIGVGTLLTLRLGGGSAGAPASHVWEVQGDRTLTLNAPITATANSGNTLTKTGTGTLTLNANSSGAPFFSGGLTIAEGTVLANRITSGSSTGSGPVTVLAAATLGGRGRINPTMNQVTIQPNGILSAGTGVGTETLEIFSTGQGGLTMQAGSTLAVRLFGTGPTAISRVNVLGNTTTDISTDRITLDLSLLTPTQVAQMRSDVGFGSTRVYTVFQAVGDDLTGDGFTADGFGFLNNDLGNFAAGEWAFDQFTPLTGNPTQRFATLRFTPVPEAHHAMAVAGLAVAGLRLWRRHRPRSV